ncbi:MAG: bifunctional folylpolyglutamate synthase/dihydrofolate synthase [Chloroflexi bacterium]|nr:bifunctional folylpolyglutamate synthase/dihydrofolate synthase [Chloroflexota bacterium]
MEYLEALRFLKRRDDWERSGSVADAERWDLRRMHSLLARLGDPHLGRHTVHVAGSKGKGSISKMIASILEAAGASTGLYTKPHLHRFVERIATDGETISQEDFGRLVEELSTHVDAEDADGSYGRVSTFEALVVLAFLYFREREVDWQVFEVGLGGRLDATNVFDEKEVCIIAPISLEHTEILGDTVPQITEEKAAIITSGCTVIMAPQRESAADVVRRVCEEKSVTLVEVAEACQMSRAKRTSDGQEFTVKTARATYNLKLPLFGRHQLNNAATAVLAVEAMAEHGIEIDEASVRQGLAAVRWPGRIEFLKQRPAIIADGAHNRDSARALVQTLRDDFGLTNVTLVVGSSGDKDIEALAEELAPLAVQMIATRSRHPRAMNPREIAEAFLEREVPIAVEEPVGSAIDAAIAQAGSGPVVICGSLFVAAEAREHVLGIAYDPPLTEPAPPRSEVNV